MNRNQRSAHTAATPPHTASTAIPNQSTDTVMACDSASVSAPDGVNRAAHFSADGTSAPSVPFWLTECGHVLCNSHLSDITIASAIRSCYLILGTQSQTKVARNVVQGTYKFLLYSGRYVSAHVMGCSRTYKHFRWTNQCLPGLWPLQTLLTQQPLQ